MERSFGELEISSESLIPPINTGNHIILQTVDGRVSGFNAKMERDWFYQAVLPSLTLRGTSWPLLEEGLFLQVLQMAKWQ